MGRVPVTTVPLPLMVNARSTQTRTGAPGSGAGRRVMRRPSAARRSGSPWPVAPLTVTASTSPREVRAISARAWARALAGSARSERVTTSSPWRTRSASMAARCSADCGIQPSSAATTIMTAGTGPTPASMFVTNRSCPGTSTNASRSPRSRAVQANPRSIVMPRRRSSAQRSGSIPVSSRTRVDLPWSTWPMVATTCTSAPRGRRARGRRGRRDPARPGPRAGPAARGRPRPGPRFRRGAAARRRPPAG